MSEFWKRLLSGVVYIAIVVGTIVSYPQPWFYALVGVLAFLAAREFHALTQSRASTTYLSAIAASAMCIMSYMLTCGNLYGGCWLIAAYLSLLIYLIVSELFNQDGNAISNWGKILGSQVMIAFPFALMNVVIKENQWLMLALFVLVWTNDTCAYCVGSLMSKRKGGNHQMAPRISPKKSWEGLIGGLVFTVIAGALFSIWVDQWSLWQWMLIGLLVGIAGTLGDLVESQMKRTIGVKDSGHFMPGHGGVLDRFDSMLLVVPVIVVIILIM